MKTKKPKTTMELYNSIRKEWDCKPVTKIVKSKKVYNRKNKNLKFMEV